MPANAAAAWTQGGRKVYLNHKKPLSKPPPSLPPPKAGSASSMRVQWVGGSPPSPLWQGLPFGRRVSCCPPCLMERGICPENRCCVPPLVPSLAELCQQRLSLAVGLCSPPVTGPLWGEALPSPLGPGGICSGGTSPPERLPFPGISHCRITAQDPSLIPQIARGLNWAFPLCQGQAAAHR